MTDIKDQKKLTDGKGWGVVEWARKKPHKIYERALLRAKIIKKNLQDKQDKKD